MESKKRRRISEGKEFDHLFPPPSGEDRTIKKNADVADTVQLIQSTVPKALWHTEKIARKLKGNTLEETCSNIWHFVYGHIQYKRDEDGVEQVRSPRRTWWERETGVDCDCYTEFISSILLNLKIPHKARIAKYPKRPPEVPRWQHIYPVVPKDGNVDKELTDRADYIAIDCVKDDYDDEQPFLEAKDYNMQLDYLDGLDDDNEDVVYETVDAEGIASLYDDDELGKISLKKAFKKVGSGLKKATKSVGKAVKKVGDAAGKGIRFINRYVNPATLLLRNGFLLAMKANLMNVGKRLRYAYLSDAQAQKMGIDVKELQKLRKVKDRAETVYWQAGGKKENLRKAILGGKGNKDKKVVLSGLYGPDDNIYADQDEYDIIHSNFNGLGELGVVETTALAVATGTVTAISVALKQVKGLFSKDPKAEQEFASDKDTEGGNVITSITSLVNKVAPVVEKVKSVASSAKTAVQQAKSLLPQSSQSSPPVEEAEVIETEDETIQPASNSNTPAKSTNSSAATGRTIPAPDQDPLPMLDPLDDKSALPVKDNSGSEEKGFVDKATTWMKENPGKTLLITGGVVAGGVILSKFFSGKGNNVSGLNGVPGKRKNKKRKARSKSKPGKIKVQPITF